MTDKFDPMEFFFGPEREDKSTLKRMFDEPEDYLNFIGLGLGGVAIKGLSKAARFLRAKNATQPIKDLPKYTYHGTDKTGLNILTSPNKANYADKAGIYTFDDVNYAVSFVNKSGKQGSGSVYRIKTADHIKDKTQVLKYEKPDKEFMLELADDIKLFSSGGSPKKVKELEELQYKLLHHMKTNKQGATVYQDSLTTFQSNYLRDYGYRVTIQHNKPGGKERVLTFLDQDIPVKAEKRVLFDKKSKKYVEDTSKKVREVTPEDIKRTKSLLDKD